MSFPFIAALSDEAVAKQYSSSFTFPTGHKGMTEDGSEYRLCKAGAALTEVLAAKINYNRYLAGAYGDCLEGSLHVAIAVGDKSAEIHDTLSRAKDYFKDGYFVQPRTVSTDGDGDVIMRIQCSDLGNGTTQKIYVAAPFTVADAITNTVQCYPNPWGNVRMAAAYSSGYEHFCCMANQAISSGYYFWGKVKGPFWCYVGGTGVWPGAAAQDRQCTFLPDGHITMEDIPVNTPLSPQKAGYLMFSGNYGDVLLMLQIE